MRLLILQAFIIGLVAIAMFILAESKLLEF